MQPVGPNPSVHVRAATDQDVGFLADVVLITARSDDRVVRGFDEGAWRTSFNAATLRQVSGEVEHDTTYVIEVDGERAGRMRLVRPPAYRELAGIQLLPAHQGHGLGTHLIEQFLVDAHDRALPARLRVQRDNPRARRLYERLGFVEVDAPGGADDDREHGVDDLSDGAVLMEWRA